MSASPDSVRFELRSWLAEHWDPTLSLVAWRSRLVDAGWAVPTWPAEQLGRGLPAWADKVVAEEMAVAGAVGLPLGSGVSLALPTLVAHGDPALVARLLRPTLVGEVRWCQLFSEPGAGSDLASLATSAVLDGEEWVVNGQKVWTTGAQRADVAMLLARTDPRASKHAGISYFVLPMRQPGVEVRPIVQMNGHMSFNAVFLTDATVPAANLVGAAGDGWRIARTTLARERAFATMRRPQFSGMGRAIDEARAEAAAHFATYSWYPQRAGRADLLGERAETRGLAGDPLVRQAVAGVHAFARANEWTATRAREERERGRPAGPEGSIGKLAASELARASARAHSTISGPRGMLSAGPDPTDAVVAEVLVSTPAQSIAGGTDEIQRNIVAEKILGLPREPHQGDTHERIGGLRRSDGHAAQRRGAG